MSTKHGLQPEVADAAKAATDAMRERTAELRQLELTDPLSAEELLEAKQELGFGAGKLAIVTRARENRGRGRPAGSPNKANDELRRYLLEFGTDPLVGAMRLQSENPLVLAELWGCKPIEAVDRQLRARELVAPYMHGKQPVQVNLGFAGVADLIFDDGPGAGADPDEDVIDLMPESRGDAK